LATVTIIFQVGLVELLGYVGVFVGDDCVCSLAGYPPFSPDRNDKPMQQQILTGDYQHYMREKFWDSISDNGGFSISACI